MKKILTISAIGSLLVANSFFASAQYDTLKSFNGTNGSNPLGSLITIGHELFGMTNKGGPKDSGVIFSISTNGLGDNTFVTLTHAKGEYPYANLTYGGGRTLYGMTYQGGATGFGDIFSVDTNGGSFRDLHDFSAPASTNGANPEGSLIISGHKLYGMSFNGGVHSLGTIFSMDTNGGVYTDLYDFSTASGYEPTGSLLLVGSCLYGMNQYGGANGQGDVFSIDTNGTRFKDRWDFNALVATNGSNPLGSLIIVNHTLFGMTETGGVYTWGNIFKLDTAGTRYTDLWDFDGARHDSGATPYGDLTLKGHILFGMTSVGGSHNLGNIFRIDTAGTNYSNLWSFASLTGDVPNGNITLSGSVIYGMTSTGGPDNDGVIFSDTLIKVSTTDTNITCNGSNNGHATVYVTGGIAPFVYSWTSGSTKDIATGLSAGSYTITVTDNDGFTATAKVSITQPSALAITMASNSNELCNGYSTAGATANAATGGVPNYTYNWTPNGGTNLAAPGLTAGTYTITATDKNGCTATATVDITQPTAITATIYMKQDDGISNGVAAVTPSGGTPPYTYSWSPTGETTDTIKGLHGPRPYCCTITDNNNCSIDSCVAVTSDAGVEGINNSSLVQIYPDPNNGHFTLAGATSGQIVEIYDYTGQKISSITATNNTAMQFNIADKANGIYLIRIQNKDGSLAGERKIIKTQ